MKLPTPEIDWFDIQNTLERTRNVIGQCLVGETKNVDRIELVLVFESLRDVVEELRKAEKVYESKNQEATS